MITQQYEKVMQQRLKNEFIHKCELNVEKYMLHAFMKGEFWANPKLKDFNSLIVISKSDAQKQDDDDEWNGFVDSIKKIFNTSFQGIHESIG